MATTGMNTRVISSATSPRTFSGCAVRPLIGSGWSGVSPGGTSYQWPGAGRWRGSTSLSALNTDGGGEGRADRGPAGGLGPVRRVEMLGLGQRPAARGQAGADTGQGGVARHMVGDHRAGLADRLPRFGLAHVLELLRDRLHVALAQLAAEQGEQRYVVDVGYTFWVAGPQPLDGRAEEGWQRHVREPSR